MTTPTPGIMRAAEEICKALCRTRECVPEVATLIEEHTGAAATLDALRAAKSILWMAKEYAEAGGSGGPEMRDYEEAIGIIAAADKGRQK